MIQKKGLNNQEWSNILSELDGANIKQLRALYYYLEVKIGWEKE